MSIEENKTNNEAAIQELIDRFVKAFRAKDVDGVMSVFAPEIVSATLPLLGQWKGCSSSHQALERIATPVCRPTPCAKIYQASGSTRPRLS